MKTGIELIAQERQEQIEKHGRSISQDVVYNSGLEKPLTKAASALTVEIGNGLAAEAMRPSNWDEEIWRKMMSKPYKERLIIAGALIAAEIDRLQAVENGSTENVYKEADDSLLIGLKRKIHKTAAHTYAAYGSFHSGDLSMAKFFSDKSKASFKELIDDIENLIK